MWILFLLGAVLGTLLDHLHVASGATSYAHPFLFGQAIWVPPLFGFAAAGFADLHLRLGATPAPPRPIVVLDLFLFVAAYAASAYLPLSNPLLLLLFAAVFALRTLALRDPPRRALHALLCAACGVASEIALTHFGAFTHLRADVLGVPYWLPGLYLLAAPFIADLADLITAPALALR